MLPEVGEIELVIETDALAVALKPPEAVAMALLVEVELVGVAETWSVPFFDGELCTCGMVTLPKPLEPNAAGLMITPYLST